MWYELYSMTCLMYIDHNTFSARNFLRIKLQHKIRYTMQPFTVLVIDCSCHSNACVWTVQYDWFHLHWSYVYTMSVPEFSYTLSYNTKYQICLHLATFYRLLILWDDVPCILISVPVIVCLKKVQIGPKRSKKSLTNVIAKYCSRIRESDHSTIYSIYYITVFSPRYRLLRVSNFKENCYHNCNSYCN